MENPIRVMLVDDDPYMHQVIASFLKAYEQLQVVSCVTSYQEAAIILKTSLIDVVFLDVELGEKDGFMLASFIKDNYPQIALIFLTGHIEFAIKGYDYESLDYIVKPINEERLKRTVDRIKRACTREKSHASKEEIGLETSYGTVFVSVDNLIYCELRKRKLYVGRKNGDEICCNISLDKMEKLLEPHGFIRVYQSVLLKQSEIEAIEKDDRGQTYHVVLKDRKISFPASRRVYYNMKKTVKKGFF